MKSNSSANSRDGIRLKVLLPVALLAVLIVIVLVFARSHPQAPLQTGRETTAANNSTTRPETSHNTAHASPAFRALQPETEPETARLISILFDKSASAQLRRQAARSLGKIGTGEAMAALKSALKNDLPPYVKAAIAEGLGQSPNPEAQALLNDLANGKDETTARGAVRGLASRGDAGAVDTLGNLLFNDQTPMSVRTEAALGLGDVDLPAAQDLLTRAVSQIHDEDVLESVLDGLGRRPFSDTEEFFANYLNSPNVPPESKVLAIESVRDADGDVLSFLSKYLNDANPDVRAAAQDAVNFLSPISTKSSGVTQK